MKARSKSPTGVKNEPRTWTFQPDPDVRSLLSKVIIRRLGRNAETRGLRSKLINEALRLQHAALIGKRECNCGAK